jgi:hypothetical protein
VAEKRSGEPFRPGQRRSAVTIMTAPAHPAGGDWRDRAACRSLPLDLFDLDHASHRHRLAPCESCRNAVLVCAGCPVRRDCREEGLATGDRFHVRAGGALVKAGVRIVPAPRCLGCGLPVLHAQARTCCAGCAAA